MLPKFTKRVTSIVIIFQRAKKVDVVSDSPGLVDFSIGLMNSVLNLPAWKVKFLKEF